MQFTFGNRIVAPKPGLGVGLAVLMFSCLLNISEALSQQSSQPSATPGSAQAVDKPGVSVLQRTTPVSPAQPSTPIPPTPTRQAPIPLEPEATSADAGSELDGLITKMVLDNIPHTFEETKDWGDQDERWNGLKVRRDGFKIRTKRRKKMVNHGTWKKYSATLVNPNEEFSITVKNMRETADEKVAFDVHFAAHLNIAGRQSKWVKGVQLYSISAKGHTKIRMVVGVELGVAMDVNNFPPDLVFVPVAKEANLEVDEFRIDRVSKAGGEFAQQVSKGVRKSLDQKIAEKEDKLVEKLNKEFAKNQSKLKLSIADALKSKWTKSAQAFMPATVRQALEQ